MTPTKLSTARARLLLDHPFFGVLALRLQFVEDTSIPTLAVDGKSIFYNPQFVDSLSDDLCRSAIAHEVMHPVLDHMSRRGGRAPRKWNAACDYAANLILSDAGLPMGPDWLINRAYRDMSAEEIYAALPDDGDAAQDEIREGEASSAEDDALEWKLATVQAAKMAQSRGTLPGSLKRLLDDALSPPIPWREALAQFMTERTKDDYSWRRPNAYYAHTGVYLPSMDGVGMGEVVIALDTSGSVLSVLDEFGSTVKDVLNAVKPSRVHVVYCDAQVNHVDTFDRGQEITFEAHGGGGTDFRPVFTHVVENNIHPACLLYLTDMYGTFPDAPPEYPTLWCATTDVAAPFGDVIRIK